MLDLTGSRIFITGGAGFIGSHICDILLDEGVEEVILLDNFQRGNPGNVAKGLASGRVTLIEGDMCDKPLLADLMGRDIDYCFHMAAMRITQCVQEPRQAIGVMINATYDVLDHCVQKKIKKLVMASSASIYGQADIFPTTENHHPYNNRTLYGAAKTANEQIARSMADMYGLNYVAMRYFNVYGSRMDVHGRYTEVLIRWFKLLQNGKRPLIFGDGDQTMDFIDVRDVARANVLALKAAASDESFNVAMGKETSLKELCETLIKVVGVDVEPEFVPLPQERKAVEVIRRLASTEKAEMMLGFKAEIDLESGLRNLVAWLKQQENS
jgi:UDP-glucose 4-epimerase